MICGFVTNDETKWKQFIADNLNEIETLSKNECALKNGERWVFIKPDDRVRGRRFSKAKIDKDVDNDIVNCIVLPRMIRNDIEFI